MTNIKIENLTFGYSSELIFDQVNINIDDSWRLGLVGRNGRGKTTLLRILQGNVDAELSVSSDKNFIYFPQEIQNLSALTMDALQELADFEPWQLERELNLLSVSTDVLWRPFDSLSGGEQTKVLLALLFIDQTNFPLIDEPTNHLDLHSRELVADYLKRKSGFIVVSHDRAFLDAVTDHTLAIERRQVKLYQGNFRTYEEEKRMRDAYELAEDEKLRRNISRLKETARDKAEWSRSREKDKLGNPHVKGSGAIFNKGGIGARAARVMKKSKNLEKRMQNEISDQEKLLKNIEKIDPLEMNFQPDHHKTLLRVKDFSVSYDSTRPLFEPVTFELTAGKIIALTGQNGIGKSSLLCLLMGDFQGEVYGEAQLAQGIQTAIVRQIYHNQGNLKTFAEQNQVDYQVFLSNLRKLGMERSTFSQNIETMSQGQQKKVELAKALSQPAQLYIWDEPLNYLDVFNHEQIIALLKSVKPTMLVVEHDQRFISEVADEQVHLEICYN